jgi:hypothetical protein
MRTNRRRWSLEVLAASIVVAALMATRHVGFRPAEQYVREPAMQPGRISPLGVRNGCVLPRSLIDSASSTRTKVVLHVVEGELDVGVLAARLVPSRLAA